MLKTTISDFYNVEDISEAKKHLLDILDNITTDSKLPHIPKRREGVNRFVKELDDIFTVLQFLDENGMFNTLPTYVCDNPDKMPSLRLFEGDMAMILSRLDKLETKVSDTDTGVAAIASRIDQIGQELCTSISSQFTPSNGAVCNNVNTLPTNTRSGQKSTSHNTGSTNTVKTTWAATMANFSTPVTPGNVIHTHADVHNENQDDSDAPFTLVQSRKKKRKFQNSPNTAANINQNDKMNTDKKKRQGKTVLVGQSKSDENNTCGISAAEPMYKKSVFCIDNVDKSVSLEEMKSFLSDNLSVQVLSIFNTKPRKKRNEKSTPTKRNAFRLCINSEHRDKLLDITKWPQYIHISEWFFKGQRTQTKDNNPVKSSSNEHLLSSQIEVLNDNDNDNTITDQDNQDISDSHFSL